MKYNYNKPWKKEVNEFEEELANEIFVEEKNKEPKKVIGIVTDCLTLNVRKEPSLNSDIIDEFKALSDVEIISENSLNDFYTVKSEKGLTGYCMKKYIQIKKN